MWFQLSRNMMNFIPYIIFSVCLHRYIEASVISTNNPGRGPYVTSNIDMLHFQGKSYYIGANFKTTFLQASQFCEMIHMKLVAIHSAAESEKLYRYIMETIGPGNNLWSSGTRLVDDRTWLWLTTGETMRYKNWVSTQPDNTNNNEKCIELAPERGGLYWNDVDCQASRFFVCEKYDDEVLCPNTSTNNEENGADISGFIQPRSGIDRKCRD